MHEHEPGQIELKRYTSPESDHHARSLILKTKKKNPNRARSSCPSRSVDGVPVRVFKNHEPSGVPYLGWRQAMRVHGSLWKWNGESWATQGGRAREDQLVRRAVRRVVRWVCRQRVRRGRSSRAAAAARPPAARRSNNVSSSLGGVGAWAWMDRRGPDRGRRVGAGQLHDLRLLRRCLAVPARPARRVQARTDTRLIMWWRLTGCEFVSFCVLLFDTRSD